MSFKTLFYIALCLFGLFVWLYRLNKGANASTEQRSGLHCDCAASVMIFAFVPLLFAQ